MADDIGPYKRHELLTGKIYYPALGYSGYGDGKSTPDTLSLSVTSHRSASCSHVWAISRKCCQSSGFGESFANFRHSSARRLWLVTVSAIHAKSDVCYRGNAHVVLMAR